METPNIDKALIEIREIENFDEAAVMNLVEGFKGMVKEVLDGRRKPEAVKLRNLQLHIDIMRESSLSIDGKAKLMAACVQDLVNATMTVQDVTYN